MPDINKKSSFWAILTVKKVLNIVIYVAPRLSKYSII